MVIKKTTICCGLETEIGSHVLFLYQNDSELSEVFLDFAEEGIKNNDLTVIVSSKKESSEKIKNKLSFNKNLQKKTVFALFKDFYLNNGKFSPEFVHKKIDSLLSKNSKIIRGASDLKNIDDKMFDDFYEYEKTLSERLKDKNILFMCAYPAKNFGLEQIIKLMRSHMKIIFKEKNVWRMSETVQRDIC